MKNYLFTRNYIKQIFADDPTEPTKEQQSTEQSTESQEGKTKEADPPKPDDKGGEKKYTDADIDKIVNTRLAREREKHQKDVDEAKKLGEMGAQERAETSPAWAASVFHASLFHSQSEGMLFYENTRIYRLLPRPGYTL